MVNHVKILSEEYVDNDIKYMTENISYLKNIILSMMKARNIDINRCDVNIKYFSPLTYYPDMINDVGDNIIGIVNNTKIHIDMILKVDILGTGFNRFLDTRQHEDITLFRKFDLLCHDLFTDFRNLGMGNNILYKSGKCNHLVINCDHKPQKYDKIVYLLTNNYRKTFLNSFK